MDSILVIEDTESLREILCSVLSCEGYNVTGVGSAEEGLECLISDSFSLALSDLKLPGLSGIDFVKQTRADYPTLPVVVMTAYGSIDIAVQAMKFGATDFITKPFDPSMLCEMLRDICEHSRALSHSLRARPDRARKLISQSPAMETVIRQMRKVAPLSSPVMLLGESGTGKELMARAIHELSPRLEQQFVPVNCGSLPSELMESEFFGHEEGSFTGATQSRLGFFEIADKGTIFLDEIGNMPTLLQMKLLRALQESEIKPLGSSEIRKVNIRVISATNCDIEREIKKGRFREDLYYRLGVVIIEIPPLRERKEDIELLANFFIKSFAADSGSPFPLLTPSAIKLLKSYHWPGNVRELENAIERAMVFAEAELTPDLFELGLPTNPCEQAAKMLHEVASEASRNAETQAIQRALIETKGNKTQAARLLGVSYKTLLNKVRLLGLEPEQEEEAT